MSGEFQRLAEAMSKAAPVRVKVLVKPHWCPPGEMFVIHADRLGIDYDPAPFFEERGPYKVILVHDEREAFRVRETIQEYDGFELVEDESDAEPGS